MRAETERGSWMVQGQPIRIDYSLAVVEEICALAVDGLSRLRRGGMEVGGILFGIRHGPHIQILAFRPLPCEHAHGPSFTLSEKDEQELEKLLEASRRDGALRGLGPVGWYHSHTRSEICLTAEDLQVHGRFFHEPWQIAMVIRPSQFGPSRVGFFFREEDGGIRTEASYLEFSVRPQRRGETRAESPAPPVREAPPPLETTPPPVPSFALVGTRPPRKWFWLAALLLVALAAAGYAIRSLWPPRTEQSISLRVMDLDGQLIIEWNRASPPIQKARRATFEILDGAERQVVEMEGERLREGSLTYARRSDKVDVRCQVVLPNAAPVEEFIRFLGQPPPARPTSEQAEALRQRDELQQQVEKMRAELALKNAQIRRLQQRARQPAASPPAGPVR